MVKLIGPQRKLIIRSYKQPQKWWVWAILGLVALLAAKEFIKYNDEGEPELAPERAAKLAQELENFDYCEQYALLASKDDWHPCYSCVNNSRIFLKRGFVWKYGVTCAGEQGRYGRWHIDNHLFFYTEFEGPLQSCLIEEKTKIYNYAIHPENLSRAVPLIRPPGNKQDN